jgi:hypothetical protein
VRYRKKPVVIDAIQFTGKGDAGGVIDWVGAWDATAHIFEAADGGLTVETLEGSLRASPGDWIIRGVKGEFYPCKPDIFAETYEPASALPPDERIELLADARDVLWRCIDAGLEHVAWEDADRRLLESLAGHLFREGGDHRTFTLIDGDKP